MFLVTQRIDATCDNINCPARRAITVELYTIEIARYRLSNGEVSSTAQRTIVLCPTCYNVLESDATVLPRMDEM